MATAAASTPVKIAIIGGTGLDDPDILEGRTEKYVDTPFGKPSDALILGKIKNVDCVLLARHGRHHTIMPSNINYRANLWALREEGCSHVLATTACGSLREEIQPGDIVMIDQFIDRSFIVEDLPHYVLNCPLNVEARNKFIETLIPRIPENRIYLFSDADPYALYRQPKGMPLSMMGTIRAFLEYVTFRWQNLSVPKPERLVGHALTCVVKVLMDIAKKLGIKCHSKGTMITIEGPRFSSRAESLMFRSWGGDVINMTTIPEVILAKEAGLCYASIAMATDYDCWKEHEEAVSVDKVLKTLKENANKATSLLLTAIPQIGSMDWTETQHNLKSAVQLSILLPKH